MTIKHPQTQTRCSTDKQCTQHPNSNKYNFYILTSQICCVFNLFYLYIYIQYIYCVSVKPLQAWLEQNSWHKLAQSLLGLCFLFSTTNVVQEHPFLRWCFLGAGVYEIGPFFLQKAMKGWSFNVKKRSFCLDVPKHLPPPGRSMDALLFDSKGPGGAASFFLLECPELWQKEPHPPKQKNIYIYICMYYINPHSIYNYVITRFPNIGR